MKTTVKTAGRKISKIASALNPAQFTQAAPTGIFGNDKKENSKNNLCGTDLFSHFTADIIKKDVFFIR